MLPKQSIAFGIGERKKLAYANSEPKHNFSISQPTAYVVGLIYIKHRVLASFVALEFGPYCDWPATTHTHKKSIVWPNLIGC